MPPDPAEPAPAPAAEPVPPDLLAWALQTLDVDDSLEQVREIERGEGHSLESVLREIESGDAELKLVV